MPSSPPDDPLGRALDGLLEHERGRTADPPPPAGRPLEARYEIRESLGEGATARVYRAWDRELRRAVALKVLRLLPGLDEKVRERFRIEAQAAAGIEHPNVVAIHDVGEMDAVPCLVLELVEGRPLNEALQGLDERGATALLEKTARGVAAAHAKGVVHRDLKPANVLVTLAGEPKVSDFGLARLLDSERQLTRTGARLGTPLYMAPEQVEGRPEGISPRTDVYALGAILYEAVAGRPPHQAETLTELYSRILRDEPERPRRIRPGLAKDLETVILCALEKDPARRYASAAELADDLRRVLDGQPIRARPPSAAGRILGRVRRNPAAWSLGLGALVAFAAAVAISVRLGAERDSALVSLRDKARLSLEAALELRRAGKADGLRRFLPELESAYREALARAPDLAEPEYLLGRMHRALMDDGKALEFQERALRKDPSMTPAIYERAVLLSKLYAAERERVAEAHRALAGAPDDLERASSSLVDLRERVLRDCLDLERRLGGSSVREAHLLAARGILACHREKYEDAEALLRKAVALDPGLEEAWETLALAVRRRGDSGRAEEVYAEGLRLDRGYVPHLLGRSLLRLERAMDRMAQGGDPVPDLAAAEGDLTEVLRLFPGSWEAWRQRAVVRLFRARHRQDRGEDPIALFDEAERDLGRSIELKASYEPAWARRGAMRMGRAIYRMSRGQDPEADFSLAERDFEEAVRLHPGSTEAWHSWGFLRLQRGLHRSARGVDPRPDYEDGERRMSEAIRLHGAYVTALKSRGQLRCQRGIYLMSRGEDPTADFDRADQDFSASLALRPDYPGARIERGRLRVQRGVWRLARNGDPRGELAAAEEDFAEALRLNPAESQARAQRGHARFHRGTYFERAGDAGEARRHFSAAVEDYREALRLNPSLDRDLQALLDRASAK